MCLKPGIKPVQHAPRKVPIRLRPQLKEQLERLEERKVFARVTEPTEWISSLVLVQKPNKLRICLDPKDLNHALERARYPMPTVEDAMPQLANAKLFSKLDAKDGFWQVVLDKESSYYTTFRMPFGHYRWLRMPFGISTASEEFQRRLHEAMAGLEGAVCIADDTLIFGRGDTPEEAEKDHDQNLRTVLAKAREVGLQFNSTKFKYKLPKVSYCGHVFSNQGLQPDPQKVEAITAMPRPQDAKAVQRFLGLANYMGRYIPRLADRATALRRILAKDADWCWESSQKNALEDIKQEIAKNNTLLRYYNPALPVVIQCDASDYGLGACLSQYGQPVEFASRTLSDTERRYAQIEKECLAIVFACENFECYIAGR